MTAAVRTSSVRRELAARAHRAPPSPWRVGLLAFIVGLALGALVVQLGGCSYAPRAEGPAPDAGVKLDAGLDALLDAGADAATDAAVDAPGGAPLDSACSPLRDYCDPTPMPPLAPLGLTCRLRGQAEGRCRPIGPVAAGGTCGAESDCGADMTCLDDGSGTRSACFVVCDTLAPLGRCTADQVCAPLLGQTGVCIAGGG